MLSEPPLPYNVLSGISWSTRFIDPKAACLKPQTHPVANQNQVLDRPAPNFSPQAFSSALCQVLDFTWFRQDLTLVLRTQCFQKIQRNSGNKNSSRSVSTLYLQKRGLPLALTAPWQCWNLDPGQGVDWNMPSVLHFLCP